MACSLLWFRRDLRLNDNPALHAAMSKKQPLIMLYILSEHEKRTLGEASAWWLHQSLLALEKALHERGGHLILRHGDPAAILTELIKQHQINHIYWNKVYEPYAAQEDHRLEKYWESKDVIVSTFNSHLLFEPQDIKTRQGGFYQVFTPFWQKGCKAGLDLNYHLLPAPQHIPGLSKKLTSDSLNSWKLCPTKPNWAISFTQWVPGEEGAIKQLSHFIKKGLKGYAKGRDFPALNNVSTLSPHLHWGEISPHRIWQMSIKHRRDYQYSTQDLECFQTELGWREFSYYLLYHFPTLATHNFKPAFDYFVWHNSSKSLHAWQQGKTGYPLIDAGMRQLWKTGWMHNRVRMVVASFLIKDLLIDWRKGAQWFMDTLLDADLASNSMNWQWVAGCGPDAAPYFRIFNPLLQSEKFDAEGNYIKEWVPELRSLPASYIHAPWKAPEAILKKAGIILGKTYPHPMVDHDIARTYALKAYQHVKNKKGH